MLPITPLTRKLKNGLKVMKNIKIYQKICDGDLISHLNMKNRLFF